VTSGADRFSNLAAFAARHASLLDGVAAAWSQAGAGHLAVRDAAGRVVYASGAATGPVLQAPLLDGALCLEASVPALGPEFTVKLDYSLQSCCRVTTNPLPLDGGGSG